MLGMTVERLDAEIGGVSGYVRWMAYFELEPPEHSAWERSASIAYTVYRMQGGKKLNREDFMPQYESTGEDKLNQQMMMFETLAGGGKNAR